VEILMGTFRSSGASIGILRLAGFYKHSAPKGHSEEGQSRKEV